MKIQSLAVIFAIIILPIVIILSYYIHGEVDTIALETALDTKLIDSTHDAMSAFEINTANEDLSSVADSLRSIIVASTNVFFNTLATNLGISNAGNSAVDAYVPALLYTLYDGYYIYSPTRVPEILTSNDDVIYIRDSGVDCTGYVSYTGVAGGEGRIGVYTFDESSYHKGEKNDAVYSQMVSQGVTSEYGQMLYRNEDGTYSPRVHFTEGRSDNTKYKQEHILKSYMPYSARYKGTGGHGDYDVTINYTLDNYLSIEGNIGNVYYSKTGYLISDGTVTNAGIKVTDTEWDNLLSYNEKTAEEMILAGDKELSITIDPILENNTRLGGSGIEISYSPMLHNGEVLSYTKAKEVLTKLYEEIYTDTDGDGILENLEKPELLAKVQELEYGLEQLSAICYYVKAEIFSDWVYENLGDIRACDITDDIANLNRAFFKTESDFDLFHSFKAYEERDAEGNLIRVTDQDETIIFDTSVNPELSDSPFHNHKVNVIRNNIQYNLNLAISAYNEMLQTRTVQMPVISDEEWEQLLTRVSVTAFMQGIQCGMKVYNNYAIASSTNNELATLPTQIYYTLANQYNTANVTHEYHAIDCDELVDPPDADPTNPGYISFTSKEVKYDKIYDKTTRLFSYDHRNVGCYRCAIANNYEKDVYDKDGNPARGYSDDIIISLLSPKKQKAYYTAVGKARQETYKTNAITDSNGYEVYYNNPLTSFTGRSEAFESEYHPIATGTSTRTIGEIREIEITLRDLWCVNESEATVNFILRLNGTRDIPYNIVLNLHQATPQTIVVPIHIPDEEGIAGQQLTSVSLKKMDLDDRVECNKLNVKIIYE